MHLCFYFTDVFSDVFFPPGSSDTRLIESLAVFGAAFVFRFVGGLMIGKLSDLYGRKKALEWSIVMMLVPSFLVGCLPTYSQAGLASTILLIILRLIQGYVKSGIREVTTNATYTALTIVYSSKSS